MSSSSSSSSLSLTCDEDNRHHHREEEDEDLDETETDYDEYGWSDYEAEEQRIEYIHEPLNVRDHVQQGVADGLFCYSRLHFLNAQGRTIYPTEEAFLEDFEPALRLLGYTISRTKTIRGVHSTADGLSATYHTFVIYTIEEDLPIIKWGHDDDDSRSSSSSTIKK